MRHKIFKYMKTYQEFIFKVSGGSFFIGQRKFPRKPPPFPHYYILDLRVFSDFSASPIKKQKTVYD